ncbi:MAG: hypothetical protein M1826_003434 [Phylliscum demangeonii]|nr:MAG: hypothetical protein M1826_003434 [Phylliscum demangeonii]
MWASEEKEALFDALTVLGKDDIQRLASRVQTKSAFEIFFMDAAPPRREDGNWRHTAADSAAPELPCIRATAFTDSGNLAVSVTERLVRTTIFPPTWERSTGKTVPERKRA